MYNGRILKSRKVTRIQWHAFSTFALPSPSQPLIFRGISVGNNNSSALQTYENFNINPLDITKRYYYKCVCGRLMQNHMTDCQHFKSLMSNLKCSSCRPKIMKTKNEGLLGLFGCGTFKHSSARQTRRSLHLLSSS